MMSLLLGLLYQLLVFFVLLSALVVAVVVYLGGPGAILKRLILSYAPGYFKTSVKVSSVSIGLRSVAVSDFELGNPEGFTTEFLVRWRKLHVTLLQPFSAPIVMAVELEDYEVMYETDKDDTSNLQKLVQNITGPAKAEAAAQSAPEGEKTHKPFKLILTILRMVNGKAHVHSAGMNIGVPSIDLTDVGKGTGGVTGGELGSIIVLALVSSVVDGLQAAGFSLAKGLLDSLPALDDVLPKPPNMDSIMEAFTSVFDSDGKSDPAPPVKAGDAVDLKKQAEDGLYRAKDEVLAGAAKAQNELNEKRQKLMAEAEKLQDDMRRKAEEAKAKLKALF